MSRYRVSFEAVASATVTVEADNEEAAIEAAYDDLPDICAQCSGWGKDYGMDLGEWDLMDEKYHPVVLDEEDDT